MIDRAFEDLLAQGYNTVVLPAFCDGTSAFDVNDWGELRSHRGVGSKALERAAGYPISVWLHVDMLSAGPMGGSLSRFAKHHRDWLSRNINGNLQVSGFPELPGIFCWMSPHFRRFLGNLLVGVSESYPYDGILVDLRRFPRETDEPRSWMSMSFGSLDRMPGELGFDLEDFLNRPTVSRFDALQSWRMTGLENFLASLKARTGIVRTGRFFGSIVQVDPSPKTYDFWLPFYRSGLIEEVALESTPENMVQQVESLDQKVSPNLPFLVLLDSDKQLPDIRAPFANTASSGIVVLDTNTISPPVLPGCKLQWDKTGALENHPYEAVRQIIHYLDAALEHRDPFPHLLLMVKEAESKLEEGSGYGDLISIRHKLLEWVREERKSREEAEASRDSGESHKPEEEASEEELEKARTAAASAGREAISLASLAARLLTMTLPPGKFIYD